MVMNPQLMFVALGVLAFIIILLIFALGTARKNMEQLIAKQAMLKKEFEALELTRHELVAQLRDIELEKLQSDTRLEESKRQANNLWEQLKEKSLKTEQASKAEREMQEIKLEKLRAERNELLQQQTRLATELTERDAGHARQVEQFELQKQALAKEFENLANKIFEEKNKQFKQT